MPAATPPEIAWGPGPTGLPVGTSHAVLEGRPFEGGAYTMRFRFPDGTIIPPHRHADVERVTVLAGLLHLGFGPRYEAANTRPLPPGTFGVIPPGAVHYARAEGDTILQLHGATAWAIEYEDAGDDPRAAPGAARVAGLSE